METNRQFERTLVTSALPYANGHIHLGHIAGAYLPADIYVRYKRLRGDRVFISLCALFFFAHLVAYVGFPLASNFLLDVRTHRAVRNFLFVDSVLVSVDW